MFFAQGRHNTAGEKARRNQCIGTVLFPNGNAVAEGVTVFRSLIDHHITVRANDLALFQGVADNRHFIDLSGFNRVITNDVDRFKRLLNTGLGRFHLDFVHSLQNDCTGKRIAHIRDAGKTRIAENGRLFVLADLGCRQVGTMSVPDFDHVADVGLLFGIHTDADDHFLFGGVYKWFTLFAGTD